MTKPTVIALGFFDGVHLGHGALLRKAVQRARELDAAPAAFTFDRAPKEFVTGIPVPLLSTVDERCRLIRELYGIERVIVAPFDREMMTMPWQDFLEKLLLERYHAVHLVAGHDYHFGHRNAGTPEILQRYCAEHGVGCDIIPKVEREGITISSTYIRSLLESGEAQRAAEFLGHPFALSGEVRHGKGLGTKSLFPTANLLPQPPLITPKFGVYATQVVLPDGRRYAGVTDVGTRPTVSTDGTVTVETHLVDFSGDLYGQTIRVEFLARLRGEEKFASTQALHDQIERDIAAAKAMIK